MFTRLFILFVCVIPQYKTILDSRLRKRTRSHFPKFQESQKCLFPLCSSLPSSFLYSSTNPCSSNSSKLILKDHIYSYIFLTEQLHFFCRLQLQSCHQFSNINLLYELFCCQLLEAPSQSLREDYLCNLEKLHGMAHKFLLLCRTWNRCCYLSGFDAAIIPVIWQQPNPRNRRKKALARPINNLGPQKNPKQPIKRLGPQFQGN